MRDLRILLVQTRYALLAMLRTPRAILFGMVFPVLLLVLFGSPSERGPGDAPPEASDHRGPSVDLAIDRPPGSASPTIARGRTAVW